MRLLALCLVLVLSIGTAEARDAKRKVIVDDEGGLGEQRATVVRAVDLARLEALMTRLIGESARR